jgi:hypothetical protein
VFVGGTGVLVTCVPTITVAIFVGIFVGVRGTKTVLVGASVFVGILVGVLVSTNLGSGSVAVPISVRVLTGVKVTLAV